MLDGIKIECSVRDPLRFVNALDILDKHHRNSGELSYLPGEAKRNGLTFSEIPGPLKNTYTIQGSLHRYFNTGGTNENDYTLSQVKQTIEALANDYGINPERSKVANFEFGVNITLPIGMDAQAFNKYLVSANFKAFEKLNPKRPAVGYIAEFNEFSIKIYDKGYQAQTGATDLIRVEIKVNRSRWLDQFGFVKGKDLFLTDLINPVNVEILGDILQNKISSLILTPRQIDLSKLTNKQVKTFYECRDARSWEEWNSRQRDRKKAQLKTIFKKVNQPDPVELLGRLVANKWEQITTAPEPQSPGQNTRKKGTISSFIVNGFRAFLDLFKKHDREERKVLKLFYIYLPRGAPLTEPGPTIQLKENKELAIIRIRGPPKKQPAPAICRGWFNTLNDEQKKR